jgi:C-terminal processing protease CtpA/Prc
VRDQSPSQVSGIQPGDLVLAVNGIEAKQFDLNNLNGYLNSKPGRRIKLEISRNGEKIKKEIELKDQI